MHWASPQGFERPRGKEHDPREGAPDCLRESLREDSSSSRYQTHHQFATMSRGSKSRRWASIKQAQTYRCLLDARRFEAARTREDAHQALYARATLSFRHFGDARQLRSSGPA